MTAQETPASHAADPVCGMTVDIASASPAKLASEHEGEPYYFRGRGCTLEFEDDPERYLDPGYRPAR